MHAVLIALLGMCVGHPVVAQTAAPAAAAASAAGADAIKVFLECRGDTSQGCATDFFVLELPYVTWTRDRLFADVQLLVTTIETGSGAFQYTVTALGRGRFDGRADTSVVNTLPNEAEDGIRRKLARNFTLLLVPYVRTTSAASLLRVVYDAPEGAVQASPQSVKDKWNFFVLQLEANGFMSTESRQTSANLFNDFRIRRVTEQNALRFGVFQSTRFSKFEIDDSTTISNTIRQGVFFVRGVKALSSRRRWVCSRTSATASSPTPDSSGEPLRSSSTIFSHGSRRPASRSPSPMVSVRAIFAGRSRPSSGARANGAHNRSSWSAPISGRAGGA